MGPSGDHSVFPVDVTVTGDLKSTGDIHVEGVIHGNISCRALTLTGEPQIEGTVKADSVHVAGRFHGRLEARTVTLTKAARVTGEIFYETMRMAPEAKFEGTLGRLSEVRQQNDTSDVPS